MDTFDLGNEVSKLVSSLQKTNPNLSDSARVKSAWNRAIAPSIKKHVTGVFVVPDTNASEVIIYVDNQLVATDLSLQSDQIRTTLNLEINNMKGRAYDEMLARGASIAELEQVKKLKFVMSRDKYIKREHQATTFDLLDEEEAEYAAIKPIPLRDDELQEIQESVSHISDERLREAAYTAAKANLEWQKGLAAAKMAGERGED